MSSIRLSGSSSGHYDLTVPAAAGTNSIDLSKLPVLAANNKLGIGTTSPTSDLHIQRTGSNASITIEETSASNYSQFVELKDSTTSWYMANRYAITGANNSGFGIGTTSSGDMLQIDTTGRVTTPNQPYFYAGGTNNGFVNNNKIPFNSAAHNIGNHYNTSNYTFTAPVTGKYLFTCSVLNYPGTQSGGEIFFSVNGSTTYSPLARWYTITQQESLTLSAIKLLNANDTLTVRGTLDAYVTSGHGHFSGMLLG